jgi:hypothetical protein
MNWPPSEKDWGKILEDFPTGANRDRFQLAVDAAVGIYLRSDREDDPKVWRRIAELAQSSVVQNLVKEIKKLQAPPRGLAPRFMLGWSGTLDDVIEVANFYAQLKLGHLSRQEQLYSNLLVAWTVSGAGPLSDSEEGPLNRVMRTILGHILSSPPKARGIRDIVHREKQRRAGVDV